MSSPGTIDGDYTGVPPTSPSSASGPQGVVIGASHSPRTPTAILRGPVTAKRALIIAAVAAACVAILLPFDAAVARFTERFQPGGDLALGGDLKREIEFVQQFGDLVCVAIVLTAIALLDPSARRRLWDALAAVGASALGFFVLKIALGRPRPQLHDPLHFGPFTSHTLVHNGQSGSFYSWEFWRPVSDLWSMPSSHTAAATALAVVLARLYPRLTPLVAAIAILVGLCRVTLNAHYPSDVAAGWALGLIAAGWAMDHQWGQRILGRFVPSRG
jgi:membrane-associated phospholipid phosphatase